jgi:hypothetical protein
MNDDPASVSSAGVPTVPSRGDAPSSRSGAVAAGWPLWQRLAFRYLLCYFVLYAFPGPLGTLLSKGFGWVDQGWQAVTTWCNKHGLAPYEVIHQPTGSGDTGHEVMRLILIALASLLLTAVWSLLQRGPAGHPLLGRWLHLVVRFDLAFTLLSYGTSKLYGGQFGELSLGRLTQEIGDTWPMTMVGTFMQASKPYELFGGLGEVLGGLLLFHRRTALLGAFVTIGVMTNVCALNWLYGVPVKLYSLHLLLEAVFLLAPFRHNLWALFVRNRPTTPVDLAVVQAAWPARGLMALGTVWVLGWLVLAHLGGVADKPWMKGREKSALYGLWIVDTMLLDGVEVPATDATRWRYFAIDRGTYAWAHDATGQRRPFDFTWDPATGIAQVAERSATGKGKEPGKEPAPWTCEQGTKVTKVDPLLLLRNEDRGRKVDGERRTLVLKGRFGDHQIELHTVEKRFRLQTGFRLRQELPDFW